MWVVASIGGVRSFDAGAVTRLRLRAWRRECAGTRSCGPDPECAARRCVGCERLARDGAGGHRCSTGGTARLIGGHGPHTGAADETDGALDGLAESGPGGAVRFDGEARRGTWGDGQKDEQREEGRTTDRGAGTPAGVCLVLRVLGDGSHTVRRIVSARMAAERTSG